jgi:hypothetical protein
MIMMKMLLMITQLRYKNKKKIYIGQGRAGQGRAGQVEYTIHTLFQFPAYT